jgi:hypothetical protein
MKLKEKKMNPLKIKIKNKNSYWWKFSNWKMNIDKFVSQQKKLLQQEKEAETEKASNSKKVKIITVVEGLKNFSKEFCYHWFVWKNGSKICF